ncbi:MAG: hypothetical protein IJ207_12145 [Treponema sp.]|uniref:hypothetical protein n=1 Tax=Treponema sp. TaxID=166 RepID=UPI0025D19F7B|nr:hypothetical protein [Treponema sp.]MBQ9282923.1 hypothetical protein [Treponema sp.]MBR1721188.1 hypothetical protein [Treponema sp.]
MKKNVALLPVFAGIAVLFASCGSTKIPLQEHSPVAVITITGNGQVPWLSDGSDETEDGTSDGILSTMVNKLIDGDNPEIVTSVDRLDYANDSIFQIVPELTGAEFLPKDKFIQSEAYDELDSTYFNLLSSVKTATGYKDLTALGSKRLRMLLEGTGAKSGIFFDYTFQKKLLKGNKWNGYLCGLVTLKAKVVNERGKVLLNKTFVAQSSEKIRISSHKYDKDAFVASLNEAIDSTIRMFSMEFAGVDEGTEALEIDDSVQGDAIALPVRTEQKSEVSEETAESESVTE